MLEIEGKMYLTAKEAAARLNELAGRRPDQKQIDEAYVRNLARHGRIGKYELDGRTNLYPAADIERVIVLDRPGRHTVRRSA